MHGGGGVTDRHCGSNERGAEANFVLREAKGALLDATRGVFCTGLLALQHSV